MLKTFGLVLLVGVVVGGVAELLRSLPDPDLWTSNGSGVIVGIAAGAIAVVVVNARGDRR